MSLHERYGERDLTFSRWSRENLPEDWAWIDIDHCAYCKTCCEPLYLIELARDVGQSWKATTITRRVANALEIPALLVFYGPEMTTVRVKRIAPNFTDLTEPLSPDVLIEWIRRCRDEHVCSMAVAA